MFGRTKSYREYDLICISGREAEKDKGKKSGNATIKDGRANGDEGGMGPLLTVWTLGNIERVSDVCRVVYA